MTSERTFVGIDFGTTNSAVATTHDAGVGELVRMPGLGDGPREFWRTILFFERGDGARELEVTAGAHAIRRYLDSGGEGRLVQSIKSHLASSSFHATEILGRRFTLEQLVGAFITRLRRAAARKLGTRAVVGRPVRYWGATDERDDERAIARMREALALSGFDEVVFEYEPIAAALHYAARLERDELVLIADFGGGTSDFSLIRVGPDTDPSDRTAVLGTGGVAVAGDNFDARVIDAEIAPRLGKGSEFADELGARAPVPPWLYSHLRRWHHLSFLRSPKTRALLERIQTGADRPAEIAQLVHVIEDDLGLLLHRAVQATKVTLSDGPLAELTFRDPPVQIEAVVRRRDFDAWISPELDRIEAEVVAVLERAGVAFGDVERVFATGGSSLVPAVRQRLARRFGDERIVGGEELTSVAGGLAVRARQVFGG